MASSSNNKPKKVISQRQEGSKPGKTDLMALFRMDFYKNKKDWKLCEDVKKVPLRSPSPTSQSKKLKVGEINIEPESEPIDLEQASSHNEAFLHEKSAVVAPDIQPTTEPTEPEWFVPVVPALHSLSQHTSVDHSWFQENSEALWQDTQQEWCGSEAEGGQAEGAAAAGPQPSWPPDYITVNPMSTYEHLDECDPKYLSQEQILKMANNWLEEHGYPLDQEEYALRYEQYGLVCSIMDFMRGCKRAPHSSEIDLSVPHDCRALHIGSARDLTTAMLVAAVRVHAAALRALLEEHTLRETMHFTPTNMGLPIPLGECPESVRLPDILLAGSHRPPDTGRGRGRLRTDGNAGAGFAVGRPYRP